MGTVRESDCRGMVLHGCDFSTGRLRQDLHDTDASLGYTKRDPVLKSQEGKNE